MRASGAVADKGLWRDALLWAALALVLRLAVAAWGARWVPPAADGQFYDVVARRIASGFGYTWLWPDGVVTYAAHYPVGYPAIVGGLYAVFGPHPGAAMYLAALLGAVAVLAVHRITLPFAGRRGANWAAGALALCPTLVAYVPALMTEGLASSGLMVAGWLALAQRGTRRWPAAVGLVSLGVLLGGLVLVRPQLLLLVPVLGAIAGGRGLGRAAGTGLLVTLLALGTCLPWTLRNCERMGSCLLVSANGGWNLLIGTAPQGKGAWVPLEQIGVPTECREVFQEAAKDACFGAAARRRIAASPAAWLALVPAKLSATFDDVGGPSWYLAAAAPQHFPESTRVPLNVAEWLWSRAALGLAALGLGRQRTWSRFKLAGWVGGVTLLAAAANWLATLLVALVALRAPDSRARPPLGLFAAVVLATAATHAVFFGAARYSYVVLPFLAMATAAAWGPRVGRSPTE